MTTPAQWLFQPFEWTHSKSRTHTSLSMQVCTRLHTHTHGQTISRTAKSNLYEQIAAHLLKLIVTQCYTMILWAGQAVTGRCSTVCVLNFEPQSGENSKQQCWCSSMTRDNWVFTKIRQTNAIRMLFDTSEEGGHELQVHGGSENLSVTWFYYRRHIVASHSSLLSFTISCNWFRIISPVLGLFRAKN